ISYDDIFNAFEKVNEQIKVVMKDKRFCGPNYGTNYQYRGIDYKKRNKTYKIRWAMG
ncbi:MAG: hypothetical protein Satyrvirus50_4, partial [Satyrvirus sp.]